MYVQDDQYGLLRCWNTLDTPHSAKSQYIAFSWWNNVQITKLGADTLLLSTTPEGLTEMNAGSSVMIILDATRNGREINNPAVEWKVVENDSEITDGSHFYDITEQTNMAAVDSVNDEVIISMDIKFSEENSGFKLKGGSYEGGQISRRGEELVNVKSGSTYNVICAGDGESWYHINIDANFAQDNYRAILDLYKYNDDDTKTLVVGDFELSLRTMASGKVPFTSIDVFAGTGIDNLHVYKFMPDSVELTISDDSVFVGDTVRVEYTLSRKGEEITGFVAKDLTWELYNEDNATLPDDVLVTVDSHGMVTIDPTTDSRKVYVRATLADNGVTASIPIAIVKKDIFTVTGIGLNADKTAVTEIKVNKNFAYSGDVTFVMAVYDENGVLIDVAINKITDNSMEIGENKLSFDVADLPENFRNIKIMAWTSL